MSAVIFTAVMLSPVKGDLQYNSKVLISAQAISYACHKRDTVCEFDDSL